jgi:hypothetical protein
MSHTNLQVLNQAKQKKDRDSPARADGGAAHFLTQVRLGRDGDGSDAAQG